LGAQFQVPTFGGKLTMVFYRIPSKRLENHHVYLFGGLEHGFYDFPYTGNNNNNPN
jgi:hypothetical protein